MRIKRSIPQIGLLDNPNFLILLENEMIVEVRRCDFEQVNPFGPRSHFVGRILYDQEKLVDRRSSMGVRAQGSLGDEFGDDDFCYAFLSPTMLGSETTLPQINACLGHFFLYL